MLCLIFLNSFCLICDLKIMIFRLLKHKLLNIELDHTMQSSIMRQKNYFVIIFGRLKVNTCKPARQDVNLKLF